MSKANKNSKPPIYQRRHDIFAKNFIFSGNLPYRHARHKRTTGIRVSDGVNLPTKEELRYSVSGITIHPEFLPYFFEIPGGCPQKLLLYLVFHVVNPNTCRFPFNEHICQEFINYCEAINPASIYRIGVVKQAMRSLVKANLAISLSRKHYMLNPLILSTSRTTRWTLINEYTQALIKKGKSADGNFFPIYRTK